jgi:TIGR03009 family protein
MRTQIPRLLTLAAVVGTAGAPLASAQGQKKDSQVKPAQAEVRAGVAPAADRLAAPVDPGRLARLLKLWEQESGQLKTLDVTIERTDKNPAWGADEKYVGRALLMSPNHAWLDFNKIVLDKDDKPLLNKDGRPVTQPYERIICTGDEVWQYRSDTKQIFIYPLEKQPQKRALEEGPLPFLFNFRESEARQRYEMALMSKPEEEKDHYWIGIKPRLVMDKEAFSFAYVKLDKALLLPVRLYLVSPDGKSAKNFDLEKVKPNVRVMTDNFKGGTIKDWKVIDNREGNGQAKAQPQPQPAPGRPAQPAMKPGLLRGRRN